MDVSSLIYVLNHIHRLNQGLETYVYLFALGLFFHYLIGFLRIYGLRVGYIGLATVSLYMKWAR